MNRTHSEIIHNEIVFQTSPENPFGVSNQTAELTLNNFPWRDFSIGYFEVTILQCKMATYTNTSSQTFAIGLAHGEFRSHDRFPGYEMESYGFVADSGLIFYGGGILFYSHI